MDAQPRVVELLKPDEGDDYREYERLEQRGALFRVLAANLVRELKTSGYDGRDMIGFIGHLMQAVTERGFGEEPTVSSAPMTARAGTSALEVSIDDSGRPTMAGERVVLRPPGEADRAPIEAWRDEPLVQRSLAPGFLDHLLRALRDGTDTHRVDLIMCDGGTGTPFGAVALYNIDHNARQAEVAKVIGDPSFRGKGLAGAATLLLLRYGFETLGLNRICLRTLGGNMSNIRLNERIGFRFEGVLREGCVRQGEPMDIVLMALLRSEFEESRSEG